jgi:hypothetical protein
MPRIPNVVRVTGRWLRRWAPPVLGWLALVAVFGYLIGGWLQADDERERTLTTFREGWLILRPTWLYAAILVAILVALLLVLGMAVARKQASRAAWREQVRAQVEVLGESSPSTVTRRPGA